MPSLGVNDHNNDKDLKDFKQEIIYKGLTRNRTIHIWDEINDEMELVVVNAISKMCNPDSKGNKLPITIKINSPGGEILSAYSICNHIEKANKEGYFVTTEGYSKIFSAAVPIYLMGHKKRCSRLSRFLIHDGSVFMVGHVTGEESKRLSKSMEEISVPYENILSSKSKLTKKQIKEYSSRIEDWEFWGTDSVRYGMTDELMA